MAAPRPPPPSRLAAILARRPLHPVLLGSSQVAIKVVKGGCQPDDDTVPRHHQPFPVANQLLLAEVRNFSCLGLAPR